MARSKGGGGSPRPNSGSGNAARQNHSSGSATPNVQVRHGDICFAGGLSVAEPVGPRAPGYVMLDGVEGDHGSVWPAMLSFCPADFKLVGPVFP